jgi:2-phosphosulfolactate phosphatase (EC 3.1.3.71)
MIDVCFSYNKLRNESDKLSVIIDTLRATTTIITAINNGAECIIPVETIDEALSQKNYMMTRFLAEKEAALK